MNSSVGTNWSGYFESFGVRNVIPIELEGDQLRAPIADIADLERELDALLARDAELVEHGEVSAHLARHGYRIAAPGDFRWFCYLRLDGWLRRKLFWVAPLVERPGCNILA